MKNLFKLTLILVGLIFLLTNLAQAESINWYYSFDEGKSTAKGSNKPIMIDFSAEWCGWCKKLDKDTFTDSQVINLSKKFVCIKLDADKHKAIARRYNVRGYPTILFLNSAEREIHRAGGYKPPSRFITEMKSALRKAGVSVTPTPTATPSISRVKLPISVSFTSGKAISSKAKVYSSGCDFSKAYDKSYHLRMLYSGKSYFKISFKLNRAPSKYTYLYIRHLTSMSGSKAGWAPISIYVNGKKLVDRWDTGSSGYINSKFRIGHLLAKGSNYIKFKFSSDARTHYWVKNIEIK